LQTLQIEDLREDQQMLLVALKGKIACHLETRLVAVSKRVENCVLAHSTQKKSGLILARPTVLKTLMKLTVRVKELMQHKQGILSKNGAGLNK